MKQKEIYLAKLDPILGVEQGGIRPVLIISGDTMNENFNAHICCPLTSSIKGYAGTIFLKKNKQNNLNQDSEILTFQIRTLSQKRLLKKLGEITDSEFLEVLTKLQEVLTI